MEEKEMAKQELEEYIKAQESQLDNVVSVPIGTGDYSLPSDKELYETIFLENEIETIEDFLDIVEDEDIIVKKFFETK